MKKQLSITIKLVILAVLATIGIMYVLEKSPVSEVSNYQKQEMPKPYRGSSSSDYFSRQSSTADSDAVSLTGQSGAYDEVRIGGTLEENQ